MLRKRIGVIIAVGILGTLTLQVFGESSDSYYKELERKYAENGIECYRLHTTEVVDEYYIDDENENIVSHKVTVLADGTELHDTSELISKTIEYEDENGNIVVEKIL